MGWAHLCHRATRQCSCCGETGPVWIQDVMSLTVICVLSHFQLSDGLFLGSLGPRLSILWLVTSTQGRTPELAATPFYVGKVLCLPHQSQQTTKGLFTRGHCRQTGRVLGTLLLMGIKTPFLFSCTSSQLAGAGVGSGGREIFVLPFQRMWETEARPDNGGL